MFNLATTSHEPRNPDAKLSPQLQIHPSHPARQHALQDDGDIFLVRHAVITLGAAEQVRGEHAVLWLVTAQQAVKRVPVERAGELKKETLKR